MGRSVSKPTESLIVTYVNVGDMEDYEWDMYKEDLVYRLQEKYPSLEEADKWLDNEDHVIAENGLVYIGISEYCGLMSLWVVSKHDYDEYQYEDTSGLANQWANKIEAGFLKEFGELNRIGGFSDGTSVYENVA